MGGGRRAGYFGGTARPACAWQGGDPSVGWSRVRQGRRRRDRAGWHAAVATAVTLVGATALVANTTLAAFTRTTSSAGSAAAGSVVLSDDDGGTTLISLAGAVPGSTQTNCVTVTYAGTLGAQVRMWASTGGTGLAG